MRKLSSTNFAPTSVNQGQSVNPKGALYMVRYYYTVQQLLFDIVTHPKQTLTRVLVSRISQREITLVFSLQLEK